MTLLHMLDHIVVATYFLRCRLCSEEFESFNREDPCRVCGGPTEVYGLTENLVKRLPQTA